MVNSVIDNDSPVSTVQTDKHDIRFSAGRSPISFPSKPHDELEDIEPASWWFTHRNNVIIEVLKKYPPATPLFDIGAGNGFVSLAIQAAGLQSVIVEPSATACITARKRGLDTVICSTFEDAGFSPRSVPSVGLFDVLEHIEDDFGFLKGVHSALAASGRVYITVPAYRRLWSSTDCHSGHFRRYTIKSLRQLLKRADFLVEFSTYIFSISPIFIYFIRVLPESLIMNHHTSRQRNQRELLRRNIIIDFLLDVEVEIIRKGHFIPFGGSCLIVGRSVHNDL